MLHLHHNEFRPERNVERRNRVAASGGVGIQPKQLGLGLARFINMSSRRGVVRHAVINNTARVHGDANADNNQHARSRPLSHSKYDANSGTILKLQAQLSAQLQQICVFYLCKYTTSIILKTFKVPNVITMTKKSQMNTQNTIDQSFKKVLLIYDHKKCFQSNL